jgi:hypothetical protein
VDLSGVIFVLLAVAWAVYLIPKALKHHDEVAKTRSIDRFSSAMRVLAHREPVNEKDSRLVVPPRKQATVAPAPTPEPEHRAQPVARPVARPVAQPVGQPTTSAAEPRESRVPPAAKSDVRRTSARKAARRRRRILGFLLLCDIGVAVAAYLAYLQWSAVAVPGGLTLLYLVLCRTQVRHENVRPVRAPAPEPVAEAVEQPHEVADPVAAPLAAPGLIEPVDADFDDAEDTVGIQVAQLQAALATADGTTLWDPLPVTLPTYVSAPKAKRTVRTIDLGEPGTWTSGRTAEDAEIAARAAADEASRKGSGEGGQAAAGS